MRPTEALQLAISAGIMVHQGRPGRDKPGAIVSRMGTEARQALKQLTSDELAQVRVEPWEIQDEAWVRRQEVRKLLADFDHRLGLP